MIVSLMHKNVPVVSLDIDMDGNVLTIGNIHNPELMPLSTKQNPSYIKNWLKERAVPKTRSGIATVLEKNGVLNTQSLLIRNLGVSLNDTYWIKPINSDYEWDKINLFTNDFSPSEQYDSMGKDSLGIYLRLSPNSSLQGELKKKWFIDENGTRILVKGNYGNNCQQSLNEELATLINSKQNISSFVKYTIKPYTFDEDTQAFCCFSDNFVHSDKEEFIPAWELTKSKRYESNTGEFNHFVNVCDDLGMDREEVIKFLSYQILLDYLISNTDRHQNNFGIIRNADDLMPLKMAPIYDCGNSMFWTQTYLRFNTKELEKIETCSFNKKESELLKHVSDMNLLDIGKIATPDEIYNIYSKDHCITDEKIEVLQKCYKYKADMIGHYQLKQGLKNLSGNID